MLASLQQDLPGPQKGATVLGTHHPHPCLGRDGFCFVNGKKSTQGCNPTCGPASLSHNLEPGIGPEQSRGPSGGLSPRKGRACLGGMSKSATSFRTKPPHFEHDRSFDCWYRRQDVIVFRTLLPSDWDSRHDEQSASRFLRRLLGGLLSTAAWEQEGALP